MRKRDALELARELGYSRRILDGIEKARGAKEIDRFLVTGREEKIQREDELFEKNYDIWRRKNKTGYYHTKKEE